MIKCLFVEKSLLALDLPVLKNYRILFEKNY